MSPPLVVAYALAGHIEHDFDADSLGRDRDGQPVYLRDIWPTQAEVSEAVHSSIDSEMFRTQYATVTDGDGNWQNLKFPEGDTYGWGAGLDVHPEGALLRRNAGGAGAGGGHPWGRACWRCWGTL